MIVVMRQDCEQTDVDHVVAMIREMGLRPHVVDDPEQTVIAALGAQPGIDCGRLEQAPRVARVVPIRPPFEVAARDARKEPSVISLGVPDSWIGGPHIGIIAGPCSVESEEQLLKTAHCVREAGAVGLRGGAFKPRTSPYSFHGLGEEGLAILAKAREQTGLAVVTEVMSVDQVDLVADYADVLQVGSRSMQNFNLLRAVGRLNKTVLLKRGMMASLDELLLAAEYVISEGNPHLLLCERGIRTTEQYVRNTLTLAIVPAIKEASHLPILVDPSHGTGHAYMVPSMCRAAIAAGADGLLIEVHPDPERALTDGAQSINCETFAHTMTQLRKIAKVLGRSISG